MRYILLIFILIAFINSVKAQTNDTITVKVIGSGGSVPFNPIAGTNMSLFGTYPNITFNATSSLDSSLVNVMRHGAISGDSTVDNSIAIMNAVAYANTNNISTVLVPQGVNLYIKNAIRIRYSNINFRIDGTITGINGATNNLYAVKYGAAVLIAPQARYHGSYSTQLKNVNVTGHGTINFKKVTPANTSDMAGYNVLRDTENDWGGGHTVEINQASDVSVQGITILGSIFGTIGLGNIRTGKISGTTLIGLRNVGVPGNNSMYNGNMINVYALDPEILSGDDNYFGNINVCDNYLDGLTEGNVYPLVMTGVVPLYGANIGINIASEPYSSPRGKMEGIFINNNKIRHCIWGANIEGQFDEGSNSGCIMDGNYIDHCTIGIAHITNSRNANNANTFMLLNTVMKDILGTAVESYGGHGIIQNMLVEDIGLGLKSDTNVTNNFQYRFSQVIQMFPFNLSATDSFTNGNMIIENVIVRNTVQQDTALHWNQIRGIHIFTKNTQVFENITINNCFFDLKQARIGDPENRLASALIIQGRVKNLKVTNSTFSGFAGNGIEVRSSLDGTNNEFPSNVKIDNCSFIDNNNATNGAGNWATVTINGSVEDFTISNSYFKQSIGSVATAVSVLPEWANGGLPYASKKINLVNNKYYGYTNGKDVYDLQYTTDVNIDDPSFYSTRNAIPTTSGIRYYEGTKIWKSDITDSVIGWVCRVEGVAGAAIWEPLSYGGGGGSSTSLDTLSEIYIRDFTSQVWKVTIDSSGQLISQKYPAIIVVNEEYLDYVGLYYSNPTTTPATGTIVSTTTTTSFETTKEFSGNGSYTFKFQIATPATEGLEQSFLVNNTGTWFSIQYKYEGGIPKFKFPNSITTETDITGVMVDLSKFYRIVKSGTNISVYTDVSETGDFLTLVKSFSGTVTNAVNMFGGGYIPITGDGFTLGKARSVNAITIR